MAERSFHTCWGFEELISEASELEQSLNEARQIEAWVKINPESTVQDREFVKNRRDFYEGWSKELQEQLLAIKEGCNDCDRCALSRRDQ